MSRLLTQSLRTLTKVSCANLAKPNSLRVTYPIARSFQTSTIKFDDSHSKEVADLLKSEYEHEVFEEDTPEFANQFKNTIFTYEPLKANGSATGQFVGQKGDEKIYVKFNVSQIVSLPYRMDEIENDEYDDTPLEDAFASVQLVIENTVKKNALYFDLLYRLEEDSYFVESIIPYDNVEEALSNKAESVESRTLKYSGCPFNQLDPDLQNSIDAYLTDRGINDDLRTLIAAYSERKENLEYGLWLKQLHNFFK